MKLSSYVETMTFKKPEMYDRLVPTISKRDKQQRNGSDVGRVYGKSHKCRICGSRMKTEHGTTFCPKCKEQ